MWNLIKNALKIKELRTRILFTLFIFALFRLGTFIPVPGVNRDLLKEAIAQGGLLSLIDIFAGGGLSNFSIFALGVFPYINASIIMQLAGSIFPKLEELMKEGGEEGRRKIAIWTKYLTFFLALIEAGALLITFTNQGYVTAKGILSQATIVFTLIAGTYVLFWLGEIITEKGIGNGVSLIIFAGVISRIPVGISEIVRLYGKTGGVTLTQIIITIVGLLLILLAILYLYQSERRIPVQYAKRIVGRKMYGGQSTFIPIRLIQSGILPIIFASAFLTFPATIGQFFPGTWIDNVGKALTTSNSLWYNLIFFLLVVFFVYFYTEISFNPEELSENLKKWGGFIPGVRPGEATKNYIAKIINRVTFPSSILLGLIAIVPNFFFGATKISAFYFGGTSILIIIGVALETVRQIDAYVKMRHYEGLLK
ncbi:MAG TPA: preprotein translocase subunit SecY [Caldisericia bacterium]|nr:preprotein translocase subunit SecY [Caldisericia bacterium]HOL82631.1 preprotein translocase subunit SecY [Caldisericia bacterium]HPC56496.1 preprotein translocase subunit SecY [Caldisericia bacterium]HPP43303.1 preprotein translocase subunit SecY [Caldisericia bacterium]HRT37069.1 preprotein translocase subunit SecY [Caldisericia bacterium]